MKVSVNKRKLSPFPLELGELHIIFAGWNKKNV